MCPKIECSFDENYTRLSPREINTITVEEIGQAGNSAKFSLRTPGSPEILRSSITAVRRLPTTWRETYVVHLDSEFDHYPCDAIGIYAPNSDEMVERVFRLCGFEDRCIRIERTGQSSFSFEGMLSHFVKHRLDISTLLKKAHLMSLSRTAKKHRQLEYLCSREGTRDYLSLGSNWNTLADIIEEFECRPSLEDLLTNCELIKPRYYTLLGRQAEVLVGVISKTVDGQVLFGHVSMFVRDLCCESPINIPVEICFRKNKLFDRIPPKNLICFCTGTGVAPYIAFHRLLSGSHGPGQKAIELVYGFRNEEDNILRYFNIDHRAIEIRSSENNYIQDSIHIIERHRDDCSVFICGNIRMQRATFMKIKEAYPDLVEDKRIFFDNWQ
jgi:methionine synthase reductase